MPAMMNLKHPRTHLSYLANSTSGQRLCQAKHTAKSGWDLLLGLALLLGASGCQSPAQFEDFTKDAGNTSAQKTIKPEEIVLHEGDVVKITFPGAPNLNATEPIRRDGRIALQLVGDFQAAGLTPSAMEKELIKLYGPQLQVKEVSVTVE